jgi:diazepam-binding inhibitor (GABA receptor modulator, acyl-CoA-binding protein)
MTELRSAFEKAAQESQKLPKRPDNATMLKLYALYKQATAGSVSGKRPGFTDPVGQAKYDAWTKVKGLTPDEAMQAYIDLVARLKG